jgi:uncharacterized membrane protein
VSDQQLDLAIVTFERTEGAEHAYADVLDATGQAPWTREIAFVEHHGHDRIVVRGTFAGHYVDVNDEGDVIGRKTAEGAVAGAAVGALFGPAGFAAGMVAGGTIGGLAQADSAIPELRGAFFDAIRADVPEGSSAVMLFAAPGDVDAMESAFSGRGGRFARHSLSPDETQALRAAVAGTPLAAPPPGD